MEVIPGPHDRLYKYTEIVLGRMHRKAVRMLVSQGDVVVRNSNLWHRGMTNHSASPRPSRHLRGKMAAATLLIHLILTEERSLSTRTGSSRLRLDVLREQLFVKVPVAYSALRFTRSLLDKEYESTRDERQVVVIGSGAAAGTLKKYRSPCSSSRPTACLPGRQDFIRRGRFAARSGVLARSVRRSSNPMLCRVCAEPTFHQQGRGGAAIAGIC